MNYSKDGVTVAAMFDSAHPKKSGKCSVKIRVTYNRVRHYYPTGKDLMPAGGTPCQQQKPVHLWRYARTSKAATR